MTATPSPKGVEPKEPEPWIAVIKCIDLMATSDREAANRATLELLAFQSSLTLSRSAAATLTAERDEAQKRAEVAEAENKKSQAALLAMMNINQARAQSAAQATAKIAQELQIYLKEHAPDMV